MDSQLALSAVLLKHINCLWLNQLFGTFPWARRGDNRWLRRYELTVFFWKLANWLSCFPKKGISSKRWDHLRWSFVAQGKALYNWLHIPSAFSKWQMLYHGQPTWRLWLSTSWSTHRRISSLNSRPHNVKKTIRSVFDSLFESKPASKLCKEKKKTIAECHGCSWRHAITSHVFSLSPSAFFPRRPDGRDEHKFLASDQKLVEEISERFKYHEQVDVVAKVLLYDLSGGGQGFLDRLAESGAACIKPAEKMRKLLIHWCTEKPEECYEEKLSDKLKLARSVCFTCPENVPQL